MKLSITNFEVTLSYFLCMLCSLEGNLLDWEMHRLLSKLANSLHFPLIENKDPIQGRDVIVFEFLLCEGCIIMFLLAFFSSMSYGVQKHTLFDIWNFSVYLFDAYCIKVSPWVWHILNYVFLFDKVFLKQII